VVMQEILDHVKSLTHEDESPQANAFWKCILHAIEELITICHDQDSGAWSVKF